MGKRGADMRNTNSISSSAGGVTDEQRAQLITALQTVGADMAETAIGQLVEVAVPAISAFAWRDPQQLKKGLLGELRKYDISSTKKHLAQSVKKKEDKKEDKVRAGKRLSEKKEHDSIDDVATVSLCSRDWSVPVQDIGDGPAVSLVATGTLQAWLDKESIGISQAVVFLGHALHARIAITFSPLLWMTNKQTKPTRVWKEVSVLQLGGNSAEPVVMTAAPSAAIAGSGTAVQHFVTIKIFAAHTPA